MDTTHTSMLIGELRARGFAIVAFDRERMHDLALEMKNRMVTNGRIVPPKLHALVDDWREVDALFCQCADSIEDHARELVTGELWSMIERHAVKARNGWRSLSELEGNVTISRGIATLADGTTIDLTELQGGAR